MLKIINLLFLLHSVSSLSTNSALYKEVFTYHNETEFKANFASEVVEKIYGAFRQWFFTIIFCEFTYSENRILKYTENMDYGYPVLLLNSCPNSDTAKVKPKLNKNGQTTYIVSSDELNLDTNEYVLWAMLKTGVFKPRSIVIFVINVPVIVDSYFYFTMEQHFQLLWSRKITNSVLMVRSEKLKMYTYNAFIGKVQEISDYSNVNKLLSQQYDNLCGHTIRLSVYRKAFLSDETGPLKCDSNLATTVLKAMNATCKPIRPIDGSTVGDLLDNGTATGVTGDLIEGRTDFELNSRILKNSYYGYIETTYPLATDALCFVIEKEGRQSTFTTTLKLISNNMLIIFLFNVIFFITIALMSRKVEANVLNLDDKQSTASTVIELVKCYIRQTVDIKFVGPVYRAVTLMIIVYSLIINCAIDGILTSAVTYPRNKPDINTLNQLLYQTNLTLGVHTRHLNLFKKTLADEEYGKINNHIEVFNDKKIKKVLTKRDFRYAVLMRYTDALYVTRKPANMDNGKPLFHTVKECPVPCFIVYGLQFGSPFLPRLNYILHHLNQAGILEHWDQTEQYNLYKGHSKILYAGDNKERKALSYENLQEVFYVWAIGITVCCIVFVGEILWNKFTFNVLVI